MEDASDKKEKRKTINQIIIYACIVFLSAFCHSMFLMAKFSRVFFGLLFSSYQPYSIFLPSRHNHISVICNWWLDIKVGRGEKLLKKTYFSNKDLCAQKYPSVFTSFSQKYFEVSTQLFHFLEENVIEMKRVNENFYFYRMVSSGLWTKNIVPFPWFSWRAIFGKRSLAPSGMIFYMP